MLIGEKDYSRFWNKVDKRDDESCWLYLGGGGGGYGHFWLNGKNIGAHVLSFSLFKNRFPKPKYHIHHKCENPKCVNPSHLEELDPRTHMLIGNNKIAILARKTHCPKNHEYTKENTYLSKRGMRHCRKCHAEREGVRRRRLKFSLA